MTIFLGLEQTGISRLKGGLPKTRPLRHGSFEIVNVLMRFDHLARFIVNANHRVM
jgi:hypothetical protein